MRKAGKKETANMGSGFGSGLNFPGKVQKVIEEGADTAKWGNFSVLPLDRECFSYKLLVARWNPTLKEVFLHVRNSTRTTNAHITSLYLLFARMDYRVVWVDRVAQDTTTVYGFTLLVEKS